jgi:K(+)-stimulated pyrophosphate-energized sodium pump
VMNLVSLLIAPAVVAWSIGDDANTPLRVIVAIVAALIIVAAVLNSKRKPISMGDDAPASTPSEKITA